LEKKKKMTTLYGYWWVTTDWQMVGTVALGILIALIAFGLLRASLKLIKDLVFWMVVVTLALLLVQHQAKWMPWTIHVWRRFLVALQDAMVTLPVYLSSGTTTGGGGGDAISFNVP
jgi:hypothetical protein